MKVQELMERTGMNETGRAIMYIKEALNEISVISPTHVRTTRIDIIKNKRFYDLPNESQNVINVRCKDQDNTDSVYQRIPRSIYEPIVEDIDGI